MWSKLPRRAKIRPTSLFLRLVDSLQTIILMVMNEAHEDEPKCTSTSKASAYIVSASSSLVKLSHMTKTSINETGNACPLLQCEEQDKEHRGRNDNFEMIIQVYQDIQDISLPF